VYPWDKMTPYERQFIELEGIGGIDPLFDNLEEFEAETAEHYRDEIASRDATSHEGR